MASFLLALLIFFMRVVDVSIGTLRIVSLVRGYRALAGVLGFFESITWVVATGLVVGNLDSPLTVLGFAAGFATGTVLGSWLEDRIAMGKAILRVITPSDSPDVSHELRALGHGVTVVNGEGLEGDVRVAFTVIPRKKRAEVLETVRRANPGAFVTVESITTLDLDARRPRVRT